MNLNKLMVVTLLYNLVNTRKIKTKYQVIVQEKEIHLILNKQTFIPSYYI